MSTVASWSGTGLTDGTAIGTSTAGTGDTPFGAAATAGAFTVDATGLHSPRIQADQQAATDAQLMWDTAVLGTLGAHAVRMYFELSAWPGGNARLLAAHDASNVLMWWLDVTAAGILRLRDPGGSAKDTSASGLPTGTELRLEVVADGAGAVTATVYTGDGTTPWDTLSGTGFGTTFQQLRIGNPSTSPTWPRLWLDEIAVADTAAEIGPVEPPPPPPDIPTTTAPEIPVFLPGVPVGADVVDAFNRLIRDPFTGLLAPACFRARRTTALAVTENTVQAIAWNEAGIDEDPYAGWDSANPTRYVVPDGWYGWWWATGAVSLSGTGANNLVLIPSIAVNQGAVNLGVIWEGQEAFVPAGSGQAKTVASSWWVYAAPGDVIELLLYYSDESGITAVDTTPGLECRLELHWDGV